MNPSFGAASNRARGGRLALLGALAASTAFATLTIERRASACGGLFCNRPPPDPFAPLPVAQNGENVVFAITKDPAGGAPTIDAHIQILYTGDAAKFSWVVPVEAVPTLSTGTDRLFSQLTSATQPRWNVDYETSGTCIQPQYPGGVLVNGSAGTGTAGSSGAQDAAAGLPPSVQVAFQGAVGPFDAAVIKSDDPTALKTWLSDNGYTVTDAAGALIDVYVRENKYFVALKLLNGMGVSAIQPIVLTFRGTEPCVPLRLTAIAANPDMPVLVWVLADKRVVPRGFYELKIDEARIDWWAGGASYSGPRGLVSQAADDAGGNAFIAEYAGTAAITRGTVFANGQINLEALKAAMTPPVYVQQLASMGLANDPLMLGLLDKYIPMPDALKAMNITDVQFYGNLAFYWTMYAFPTFDLAGLTDAISTSIVTPRMNAQMMIDAHPYLTRLNTYLSPEEMNQDAFFFESQTLPDVSNVHTATIRTMCGNQEYMACNAPQRLELADGRKIMLRAGKKGTDCSFSGYDVAPLTSLPAAEIAWQRDVSGEGDVVLDNTAKIKAGLDANNARIMENVQVSSGAGGGGLIFGGDGAAGTDGAAGFGFAGVGGGGNLGTAGSAGQPRPQWRRRLGLCVQRRRRGVGRRHEPRSRGDRPRAPRASPAATLPSRLITVAALFAVALFAAGLGACSGAPAARECPDDAPVACTPPAPHFAADAAPLIRAHCAKCHAPGGMADTIPFRDLRSDRAVHRRRDARARALRDAPRARARAHRRRAADALRLDHLRRGRRLIHRSRGRRGASVVTGRRRPRRRRRRRARRPTRRRTNGPTSPTSCS